MKTQIQKTFDVIRENLTISNEEIAELADIPYNTVRVYITRLRNRGFIDYVNNGDGTRTFTIIEDYPRHEGVKISTNSEIKDLYQSMIDTYLSDFQAADDFENRLRIGKELRILIRSMKSL